MEHAAYLRVWQVVTGPPPTEGLPPYLRPDCLPLAGGRALRARHDDDADYVLSVVDSDGEVLLTAPLPRDEAWALRHTGRYMARGLRLEVVEGRIEVVCEGDIEGSFSLTAFERLLREADRLDD